jgi:PDZ domain-containing protein
MTRRGMTLAVSASLLAILTFLASGLRVPYIALTPGPVYNTLGMTEGKQVIQVKGHPAYPSTGRLDLTTVSVQGAPGYRPITLFEALRYWRDPNVAIIPKEVQYPPGSDADKIDEEVAAQMIESQDAAKIAALRLLGEKVTTSRLVVEQVLPNLPAAGVLNTKDEIETVDGKAVDTAEELREVIRRHRPGEQVTVGYVRAGKKLQATIKTAPADKDPSQAIIGVSAGERCPCKTPYDVEIALGEEVGGPSAGLMFTLAIVDTLTPGEMTGSVHIAGTGTIDVDGQVGPIGGIRQKLVGARRTGAGHFLVPAGNWDEARKAIPAGLDLHRVETLQEAVQQICSISQAKGAPCAA